MRIQIRQRGYVVQTDEHLFAVVWTYEDGRIRRASLPAGVVPGLLMPYVDGAPVNLDRLDQALATIGLSRDDVVHAITRREAGADEW